MRIWGGTGDSRPTHQKALKTARTIVAATATPAPITTICPRWPVKGTPPAPPSSWYTSEVGRGTPTGVV